MTDGVISAKVKCLVVKNKLGPPFRAGYFYLHFGEGISEMRMAMDVLLARGYISQSGSRFKVPEQLTLQDKPYNANGFGALLGFFKEEPARGKAAIELAKELINGQDCSTGIEPSGGELEDEDIDVDAILGEGGD